MEALSSSKTHKASSIFPRKCKI